MKISNHVVEVRGKKFLLHVERGPDNIFRGTIPYRVLEENTPLLRNYVFTEHSVEGVIKVASQVLKDAIL